MRSTAISHPLQRATQASDEFELDTLWNWAQIGAMWPIHIGTWKTL